MTQFLVAAGVIIFLIVAYVGVSAIAAKDAPPPLTEEEKKGMPIGCAACPMHGACHKEKTESKCFHVNDHGEDQSVAHS